MWMGVRTCGRVGVQMGVQKRMTVKKEKEKTHWCSEQADGHVDVNGCKQKEKRKGERKEKKEGLTAGSGHERAV